MKKSVVRILGVLLLTAACAAPVENSESYLQTNVPLQETAAILLTQRALERTGTAMPPTLAAPTATSEPTTTPEPLAIATVDVTQFPAPVAGQLCPDWMHDSHAWHPPVDPASGCYFGHEHGDAPPAWAPIVFHGHFNTSPAENTAKHAAMKVFVTKINGVDIVFRIHAASNPLDRSARYHSYEVYAKDPSGGISHWQGWYNSGDPVKDRVPRHQGEEPTQRPVILVVDQTAWDQGTRCEQWYSEPGQAAWGWDFGWTICGATTLYQPNESKTATDVTSWVPSPDGTMGLTRRLEAAWYAERSAQRGSFWATQFGEIVSGPADARCTETTTKFDKTYPNVCLEQYIAPTMASVQFPGNATQKEFPGPGVKLPN